VGPFGLEKSQDNGVREGQVLIFSPTHTEHCLSKGIAVPGQVLSSGGSGRHRPLVRTEAAKGKEKGLRPDIL
jgi:hypothetical protein